MLSKEERRAHFLAKAKEADDHAAKSGDGEMRDSWLKIARDYRALAEAANRSSITI